MIIYWYCIQPCLNLRSNPSLMRFAHQNWVHSHLPSIMINLSWFFILFFCFWDVVQTANMRWRSPTEEFFLQLYCCCFCILCPNKDILLLWSNKVSCAFCFSTNAKRDREKVQVMAICRDKKTGKRAVIPMCVFVVFGVTTAN